MANDSNSLMLTSLVALTEESVKHNDRDLLPALVEEFPSSEF